MTWLFLLMQLVLIIVGVFALLLIVYALTSIIKARKIYIKKNGMENDESSRG